MEPQIPIEADVHLNAAIGSHDVVYNHTQNIFVTKNGTGSNNNMLAAIIITVLFAILICWLCKRRSTENSPVLGRNNFQSSGQQKEQDIEDPVKRLAYIHSHLKTRPVKTSRVQDDIATTNETDSNFECTICLNEFKSSETIGFSENPRCNHIFHRHCITSWLTTHKGCPLCRNAFFIEVSTVQTQEKKILRHGGLQREHVSIAGSLDSSEETVHISIEDPDDFYEESEDEQQYQDTPFSPSSPYSQEEPIDEEAIKEQL